MPAFKTLLPYSKASWYFPLASGWSPPLRVWPILPQSHSTPPQSGGRTQQQWRPLALTSGDLGSHSSFTTYEPGQTTWVNLCVQSSAQSMQWINVKEKWRWGVAGDGGERRGGRKWRWWWQALQIHCLQAYFAHPHLFCFFQEDYTTDSHPNSSLPKTLVSTWSCFFPSQSTEH